MKKSILIISYTFPPAAGIGGRRWAKFAKYFKSYGADLKIISVKGESLNSEWNSDIESIKGDIQLINSNYPRILSTNPNSIFSKLKYRAALLYVKFFARGNYYDRFSLEKNRLCNVVETSIKKNNVSHVIVTVAPFHGAYFISQIIHKHPHVFFIADFRDPWLNNKTAYGFESLSSRRQEYEKKAELSVVEKFDYVVSVSEHMSNSFRKKYAQINSGKFITFENGFDPRDFNSQTENISTDQENINIVFTGTLYNNIQYASKILNNKMLELCHNNSTHDNIKWLFYGNVKEAVVNSLNLPGEKILFGKVSKDNALGAILSGDICLLLLSDDIDFSFSTKFCEYIRFKKPILVVANSNSPTGTFITQNKIGLHLHEKVTKEEILSFFKKVKTTDYYESFDSSRFNIQDISKRYLQFLKNIARKSTYRTKVQESKQHEYSNN